MLRWRLLLGVTFIAALVGIVYLDVLAAADPRLPPGLLLVPLALTLGVAAIYEYLAMVRTREPDVAGRVVVLGTWVLIASPWLGACNGKGIGGAVLAQGWALVGAVLLLLTYEIVRYDKDATKRAIERAAVAVFGLVYIGLLMSYLVRLRLSPYGILPIVSMIVVVKLADIGAYTVGRLIGKHKMAPRLSPGKTWEGFVGGITFSVLGAVALGYFTGMDVNTAHAGPEHDLTRFIPFAIVVAVTGVVGDLVESLLKRDFGRKDSSNWMPGFGGVLDLIDSPLLAAPVACWFWESMNLGW